MTNMTVSDVTHNSIKIFWLPGFNGGEHQSFHVLMRMVKGKNSGNDKRDHGITSPANLVVIDDGDESWAAFIYNFSDHTSSMSVAGGSGTTSGTEESRWLSASVKGLAPSAEYRIRLMSLNSLGNVTQSERDITVTMLATPSSASLGSGGLAAIIVIVMIVVIVIVLVVFYVFVWRRKWGKPTATKTFRAAYYMHLKKGRRGGPESSQNNGDAEIIDAYGSGNRGGNGKKKSKSTSKIAPKKEKGRRPFYIRGANAKNKPTESLDPTLLEDDYTNANEIFLSSHGEGEGQLGAKVDNSDETKSLVGCGFVVIVVVVVVIFTAMHSLSQSQFIHSFNQIIYSLGLSYSCRSLRHMQGLMSTQVWTNGVVKSAVLGHGRSRIRFPGKIIPKT